MQIATDAKIFRPQAGRQTEFLASNVDFCLYGGAAGGGKTYAVLLEAIRYHKNPLARVTIFRRQSKDVKNQGGLWDESNKIFPLFGATSKGDPHFEWTFPSGAQVKFAHLNHEDDKLAYDGAQIPIIMFDELTHFTETQFWYMFSRNRTDSGIKPYIRATCNPEPNWVLDMIEWYIDEPGYVREDRAGTVRFFIRENDQLIWGDTPESLANRTGCNIKHIKSFQFIPARLEDNQILMQRGEEYVGSLKAMGAVDAKRKLEGNWRIKKEGKIFKQDWFQIYTRLPVDIDYRIITIDTAQKTKEENDYTVMQLWGRWGKKIYLIKQIRGRYSYPDMKLMFNSFVSNNNKDLNMIFIEDKVSGTALIQELQRECTIPIMAVQRNKDKYTRAYDCQGYVAAGQVFLNPLDDYYTDFISELISFSADGSHDNDDQADCLFDAIDKLLINPSKPIDRPNNSQYSSLMSIIS